VESQTINRETDSALAFPVKLTVTDLIAFNQVIYRKQPNRFMLLFVILAASFFVAVLETSLKMETIQSMGSVLLYVIIVCGAVILYSHLFRTSMYQNAYKPDGFILGEKLCTFAPEGMTFEHPFSLSTVKWPLVTEIIEGKDAVYVMIDTVLGYVLPYRCLPDEITAAEFCSLLRRYRQSAHA
jgi:hypothetical protein